MTKIHGFELKYTPTTPQGIRVSQDPAYGAVFHLENVPYKFVMNGGYCNVALTDGKVLPLFTSNGRQSGFRCNALPDTAIIGDFNSDGVADVAIKSGEDVYELINISKQLEAQMGQYVKAAADRGLHVEDRFEAANKLKELGALDEASGAYLAIASDAGVNLRIRYQAVESLIDMKRTREADAALRKIMMTPAVMRKDYTYEEEKKVEVITAYELHNIAKFYLRLHELNPSESLMLKNAIHLMHCVAMDREFPFSDRKDAVSLLDYIRANDNIELGFDLADLMSDVVMKRDSYRREEIGDMHERLIASGDDGLMALKYEAVLNNNKADGIYMGVAREGLYELNEQRAKTAIEDILHEFQSGDVDDAAVKLRMMARGATGATEYAKLMALKVLSSLSAGRFDEAVVLARPDNYAAGLGAIGIKSPRGQRIKEATAIEIKEITSALQIATSPYNPVRIREEAAELIATTAEKTFAVEAYRTLAVNPAVDDDRRQYYFKTVHQLDPRPSTTGDAFLAYCNNPAIRLRNKLYFASWFKGQKWNDAAVATFYRSAALDEKTTEDDRITAARFFSASADQIEAREFYRHLISSSNDKVRIFARNELETMAVK